MKKYTLGLIFNQTLDFILLMHKSKPEWQVGKLNGLGGKIEEGETGQACIAREVLEETGLQIPEQAWTYVGVVGDESWKMEVFAHVYTGAQTDAKSLEQEPVEWFKLAHLPSNTLVSLHWIIEAALNQLQGRATQPFDVEHALPML